MFKETPILIDFSFFLYSSCINFHAVNTDGLTWTLLIFVSAKCALLFRFTIRIPLMSSHQNNFWSFFSISMRLIVATNNKPRVIVRYESSRMIQHLERRISYISSSGISFSSRFLQSFCILIYPRINFVAYERRLNDCIFVSETAYRRGSRQ